MLILLDNNAPRGLVRALSNHVVLEARERVWAMLENGELLSAAEEAGFDVFLTADKNIRHQQNLRRRKIAVVILTQLRWSLVRRKLAEIAAAIDSVQSGGLAEVEISFDK